MNNPSYKFELQTVRNDLHTLSCELKDIKSTISDLKDANIKFIQELDFGASFHSELEIARLEATQVRLLITYDELAMAEIELARKVDE
jgi:hypothetical protein